MLPGESGGLQFFQNEQFVRRRSGARGISRDGGSQSRAKWRSSAQTRGSPCGDWLQPETRGYRPGVGWSEPFALQPLKNTRARRRQVHWLRVAT